MTTGDSHQTHVEPPCEPEPIKTSDEVDQVFSALVGAQGEVKDIPMRGKNPHFRSKYVTLEDALKEVRPVLAKYGLAVLSGPMTIGDQFGSVVRLCHKSGQWIELSARVKASRGIQELGAVQTYLRRFCLAGLLNTAGDSDLDGEDVEGRANKKTPKTQKKEEDWTETFSRKICQPAPTPAPAPAPAPEATPVTQLREHKIRLKELMTSVGIKRPQWGKALDIASEGVAKRFPDLDQLGIENVAALVAVFEIDSKQIQEKIESNGDQPNPANPG